jgi:glutaredoxin
MPNQQLLDYIRDCNKQGFDQEKITEALITAGWKDEEIREGFSQLNLKKGESGEEKSIDNQKNEEIIDKEEGNDKGKKTSKFNLLLIAVIAIFVIFGLVLSYMHYFARPSFAKVMGRSISNLEAVNSFTYNLNFDIDVKQGQNSKDISSLIEIEDGYFLIDIDGEVDLINSDTAWSLNLDTNTLGEEISLSLEGKNINDDIYLKANSWPEILTMFIPNSIMEKWLKFTMDDLGDRLSKEETKDIRTEIKQIYKEETENILDIFIVNQEKLVSIEGKEMYYYNLALNPEEIINLIVRVNNKLYEKDENLVYTKLNQEDVNEMLEEFNENNISFNDIEIWIAKDNYFPYKISSQFITEDFNASYELIFSNFNQITKINEPEEFLTMDELMELISDPSIIDYEEEWLMENNEYEDMDFLMPMPDDPEFLEGIESSSPPIEEISVYNQSEIIIFSSDSCPYCQALEEYITENNLDEKIVFTINKDLSELTNIVEECSTPVESVGVPFLWNEGVCLMGGPSIIEHLENKLIN